MASTVVPNNTSVVQGIGAPTDASFSTPPADGQVYVDEVAQIVYLRNKGSWFAFGAASAAGLALATAPTLGAIAESFPRQGASMVDNAAVVSGTLSVVGVSLVAGQKISALTFLSGATAGATLTHQWAALLDSTRKVLGVSPDATNTAWGANAAITFTFGTPVTIATSGLYYFALLVAASTVPSLVGLADFSATANALVPILAGTGDTGLTTPPALAAAEGAFTATTKKMYVQAS